MSALFNFNKAVSDLEIETVRNLNMFIRLRVMLFLNHGFAR